MKAIDNNIIMYFSLLILLITSVLGQKVCNLNLTAIHGSTNGQVDQDTVQLSVKEFISWTYETKTNVTMQVHNVQYIDKGSQSLVSLFSDNSIITSFKTATSDSNQLMNSGRLGQNKMLPRGNHAVRLEATHTDEFGIRVDTLTVVFIDVPGHFSCPDIRSDNKLSTSEIISIALVTVTTIGVISTCGIFCINRCCEPKKKSDEEELLTRGKVKSSGCCCCCCCTKGQKNGTV